jgi:AcrR family transcriptional regulator
MALEMRQRILEAAEKVIRQHGLVGATTRLISREAGCADGTLYVHFPDRHELFLALLDEKLPAFKEPLKRLAQGAGRRTVQTNLSEVGLAALEFFDNVMPVLAGLFGEPPLLAAYRDALRKDGRGPHRALEAVVAYLRAEQALGRVDARADLSSAAYIVIGGCFFRNFLHQFAGEVRSPRDDERFIAGLARSAWRVLAPRKDMK